MKKCYSTDCKWKSKDNTCYFSQCSYESEENDDSYDIPGQFSSSY